MTVIKTTLRCGDTLHVLVASCDAELQRLVDTTTKKAMRPTVVYSPCKPLSCGARVWIETTAEVVIDLEAQ